MNAPGEGGARLRLAREADAAALARLHREGLAEAFLSVLGERFLRRVYVALARDPRSPVVVAEAGGRVVGFVAGTTSSRAFSRRFLLRHGVPAAVAAGRRLFRPNVLGRLRESATYPGRTDAFPDAELLFVAVADGWRSRGLGGELVRRTLRELAARGAVEAKAFVAAGNEGANRFYRRSGFRLAGRVTVHGGEVSNLWVISCRS
ncbi:MAG: GNAT family N-acetyltransferase [Actinomycetota bacterium]